MPFIPCPDCGRDVSTMAPACPHCGRPAPAATTPIGVPSAPPRREQTLWTGAPSPTLLAGHIAGLVLTLVLIPLFARFFSSPMDDDRAAGITTVGWVITAIL